MTRLLLSRATACPPSALKVVALAGLLGLTACAQLPAPQPRPEPRAIENHASRQSFAVATRAWPDVAWWSAYGDKQLDALMVEALAGSPSMAMAQARLVQAQAFMQVAGSAGQPQLGANASATQQKQSYNHLTPRNVLPQGWNDYGRATLDFSWELDFWGKNRAALAAATSEAEAAAADAAQARITLSTAVAAAYAELARLHAAQETAEAALVVRRRTAQQFRQRFDNGLEILANVHQADARVASADAELLALGEQLALQRNRIAALLGAGPDRGLTLQRPGIQLARPFGLPAELPAQLLGRRPDIVAARLRVEASGQRIAQARAAFYPNVNLVAFVGVQSLGLDMLGKSGSSFGSVGPALSLPIFDGGRLRGELRGTEAEQALAVASYDRTVLQALQDIADAATSYQALTPQLQRSRDAVDASQAAWRIQRDRYVGGLSTYLDMLAAEDVLIGNRRAQSDLQSRAFALDVALVRALGGGYSAEQASASQIAQHP